MRSRKKLKNCSSSLWTCLHHMVILRTRNKTTDFLMILAWASPFNHCTRLSAQASAEGHSVLTHERLDVGIKLGQHLRRWLREDWLLLGAPEIKFRPGYSTKTPIYMLFAYPSDMCIYDLHISKQPHYHLYKAKERL